MSTAPVLEPKAVRPLILEAPELKGRVILVWVNPPAEKVWVLNALLQKKHTIPENPKWQKVAYGVRLLDAALLARWFSEIWSQGADPLTWWTVADIFRLVNANPALWKRLMAFTFELMTTHVRARRPMAYCLFRN